MSKHAVDYISPSFSFFQAYGPIGIIEKASSLFCRNNLMQVQAGQKHGRCQRLSVKAEKRLELSRKSSFFRFKLALSINS